MAAQQRPVHQDDAVADIAVVGDMAVDHEKIVVADGGRCPRPIPPVNGAPLANDVAVADDRPCLLPGIAEILRFMPDHGKGMQDVLFADPGPAADMGAVLHERSFDDRHLGVDECLWKDNDAFCKTGG